MWRREWTLSIFGHERITIVAGSRITSEERRYAMAPERASRLARFWLSVARPDELGIRHELFGLLNAIEGGSVDHRSDTPELVTRFERALSSGRLVALHREEPLFGRYSPAIVPTKPPAVEPEPSPRETTN